MIPWLVLGLLSGASPVAAQSGSCVTGNLLRVDAAFSRQGAGGTFDHLVQLTNLTNRPVTFRVRFRLNNTQVNPAILGLAFVMPAQAARLIILGNGTAVSTASRIGGGVLLTC